MDPSFFGFGVARTFRLTIKVLELYLEESLDFTISLDLLTFDK